VNSQAVKDNPVAFSFSKGAIVLLCMPLNCVRLGKVKSCIQLDYRIVLKALLRRVTQMRESKRAN
jgi:hypothetical protein